MIIADAIITNIVYRLMWGVRTSITPTKISQRNPNTTNRMITDVFILSANLVILSLTAKIKKYRYCFKHFCSRACYIKNVESNVYNYDRS